MATIFEKFGKKKFGKKGLGKVGDIWNKKVKPVVNQVAKIAKFIPGPWQPFAIAYDVGRVGSNVALGKQDPLALLRNIAQTYAFTDVGFKDGKFKFDVTGGESKFGGRARRGLESLFGGGEGAAQAGEGAAQAGETVTVQEGDSLSKIAADTGTTVDELLAANPNITDPNLIQAGQTINVPSGSGFNLGDFFGKAKDALGGSFYDDILGIDPSGKGIFGSFKNVKEGIQGATGIDPVLLLLAKRYAELTEKALEKQAGGMQDVRQELRPELQQKSIYGGGGFDLGAASLPAYAEGGEVMDMREGGESVGPGTGTSDDIPAMLSDGEFVMTAKANMGAGAVKINKKKGGIMEIVPSLEPDRQRGADNMMKLMRYFEGVA